MSERTRYYTEIKARRASNHQQTLIRKLNRSLKNRTDKEKIWDEEIKSIAGAYVYVNCKSCGKAICVKFKDWQVGKYKEFCLKCTTSKTNKDLKEMYANIIPTVLEGYEVLYYGRDEITIRKKRE